MNREKYSKKINILINLAIFLLIIWLSKEVKAFFHIILNILLPFIIAFTIAYILNPIIKKLQKYHLKRSTAVLLIFILISLICFTFVMLTVPRLASEIKTISNSIPIYSQNIKSFLTRTFGQFEYFDVNIINMIEEIIARIIYAIINIIEKLLSSIPTLFLLPILCLYFLLDYNKIVNGINKVFSHKQQMFQEINQQFRSYLNGVLIVMIVMICFSTILLVIFRIPNALFLGTIIGITDIIPYFGPWIGGIIVVIFGFGKSVKCGIISVIIVVIIQMVENNFLVPKIQSQNIDSHPILIIMAMSIFSKIFGFLGLIFAIPLLVVIQIFLKNCVKTSLK